MIVQNDYSFIGSDIRKIREAKGITRKEIAENMYISEETIRRIEKGDNDPRLSTLVPICNYLDIDIKDIINDRQFEYKNMISLRKEIGDLLNNASVEKAKIYIKKLDKFNFKSNLAQEKELFATKHYFNGILGIKNNSKGTNPSNDLEVALTDINSRFKINKFKNYNYDDFSLRILLALALNEYKKDNFDLYKDIMLEIEDYIKPSMDNYFVFSYNLAGFYTRLKKYQKSLQICNEAIASAKNINQTAYLNMLYYAKGINLLYLGDSDQAKLSFDYCNTLTNIFSTESLSKSISQQINGLLLNYN